MPTLAQVQKMNQGGQTITAQECIAELRALHEKYQGGEIAIDPFLIEALCLVEIVDFVGLSLDEFPWIVRQDVTGVEYGEREVITWIAYHAPVLAAELLRVHQDDLHRFVTQMGERPLLGFETFPARMVTRQTVSVDLEALTGSDSQSGES